MVGCLPDGRQAKETMAQPRSRGDSGRCLSESARNGASGRCGPRPLNRPQCQFQHRGFEEIGGFTPLIVCRAVAVEAREQAIPGNETDLRKPGVLEQGCDEGPAGLAHGEVEDG